MECLPLWLTYIGEKGRTLGKTCGIKARCYREHPWGTNWELGGNMFKWVNITGGNIRNVLVGNYHSKVGKTLGATTEVDVVWMVDT